MIKSKNKNEHKPSTVEWTRMEPIEDIVFTQKQAEEILEDIQRGIDKIYES